MVFIYYVDFFSIGVACQGRSEQIMAVDQFRSPLINRLMHFMPITHYPNPLSMFLKTTYLEDILKHHPHIVNLDISHFYNHHSCTLTNNFPPVCQDSHKRMPLQQLLVGTSF